MTYEQSKWSITYLIAFAGKDNTCICKWVQYLSQNNEKNLPYQNSPVLRDSLTCLKYQ